MLVTYFINITCGLSNELHWFKQDHCEWSRLPSIESLITGLVPTPEAAWGIVTLVLIGKKIRQRNWYKTKGQREMSDPSEWLEWWKQWGQQQHSPVLLMTSISVIISPLDAITQKSMVSFYYQLQYKYPSLVYKNTTSTDDISSNCC